VTTDLFFKVREHLKNREGVAVLAMIFERDGPNGVPAESPDTKNSEHRSGPRAPSSRSFLVPG
jgi:hypothetical protein